MQMLIIEYEEGCGYNSHVTADNGDEWWASKRPFNRVEMQNRLNRFLAENPSAIVEQEMIYSIPFSTAL